MKYNVAIKSDIVAIEIQRSEGTRWLLAYVEQANRDGLAIRVRLAGQTHSIEAARVGKVHSINAARQDQARVLADKMERSIEFESADDLRKEIMGAAAAKASAATLLDQMELI